MVTLAGTVMSVLLTRWRRGYRRGRWLRLPQQRAAEHWRAYEAMVAANPLPHLEPGPDGRVHLTPEAVRRGFTCPLPATVVWVDGAMLPLTPSRELGTDLP